MYKFSQTTLGVLLLSVLPALVAYLTIVLWLKNVTFMDIKPHLPFIISITIYCIVLVMLIIRKSIINKLNVIDEKRIDLEKRIDDKIWSQQKEINANAGQISLLNNADIVNQLKNINDKLKLLLEYGNLHRDNAAQADKYYESLLKTYFLSLCEALKQSNIIIDAPIEFEKMTKEAEQMHIDNEAARCKRLEEICKIIIG